MKAWLGKYLILFIFLASVLFTFLINYNIWPQLLIAMFPLGVVIMLFYAAHKVEASGYNAGSGYISPLPEIKQLIAEGNQLLDLVGEYIQQREQVLFLFEEQDNDHFEQDKSALAFHCRHKTQFILTWWIQPLNHYQHYVTPAQSRLATRVCAAWVQLLAKLDEPHSVMLLPDMDDFIELTAIVAEEIEQMTNWRGVKSSSKIKEEEDLS